MPKKKGKMSTLVKISLVEIVLTIFIFALGSGMIVQLARIYHWISCVIFLIPLVVCHTDMPRVALQMCKEGGSLSLEKWDQMVSSLDKRGGRSYILGSMLTLLMLAATVYAGFYFLAVGIFLKVALLEILINRLHKYMENDANKTKWGAASFLYEAQKTFGEFQEEEEKKGFYKDI